jgi:hypothetical protein
LVLVGPDPAVNLAHIIPDSLGGKHCTLTCSNCNSIGGTALEAALGERFVTEDVVAGVGRARARVSGSFGTITAEWAFSPHQNAWSIYGLPHLSDPEATGALQSYLTEQTKNQQEVEFSLTPDYDHRPGPVCAAMYQSAYLLLFSYFGYEFVLNPTFALLREQILRPQEDIWQTRIIIVTEESAFRLLGTHRQAVIFGFDPLVIAAVLRLRPGNGRERVLAVLLPGLTNASLPVGDLPTLHGIVIPYRPDALLNNKFYLAKLWHGALRAMAASRKP